MHLQNNPLKHIHLNLQFLFQLTGFISLGKNFYVKCLTISSFDELNNQLIAHFK
jgi:hypothetical protein